MDLITQYYCISHVEIYKWQSNKEGSKLLLKFNIVNILVSNMRGVRLLTNIMS
jgi:hypothetical protein